MPSSNTYSSLTRLQTFNLSWRYEHFHSVMRHLSWHPACRNLLQGSLLGDPVKYSVTAEKTAGKGTAECHYCCYPCIAGGYCHGVGLCTGHSVASVSLFVCPCCKRKTAWAINTEVGRDIVYCIH